MSCGAWRPTSHQERRGGGAAGSSVDLDHVRLQATTVRRLIAAGFVVVVATGAAAAQGSGGHPRAAAPVLPPPRATTTAPTTAPTTTSTVAPTTTTVAPTTVAPAPAPPPAPVAGPGIAVGDSVLEDVALYAPATLQAHGIAINAAVSRQWPVGISILSGLRAGGKLPPVVIVALGSNGRITDALFEQMMQACAGAKRVVFMTVTGPLIGNNPIIAAGVARHPEAVLADWHTLAAAHPDWFGPDHVHVGPAGAAALGNLLASFG